MRELDEPIGTLFVPTMKIEDIIMGIRILTFARSFWDDLLVFPQIKNEALLEEQRPKEEIGEFRSYNLKPFCRVLLLLVETCGRLIPPLEMSCSSNKVLLSRLRRSPMATLSH